MVLETIKSIDIRGSFEADDEVGAVFDSIKFMVNTLGAFVVVEENEKN
jgi:hypothetical protein